jgi:hypothetical protein
MSETVVHVRVSLAAVLRVVRSAPERAKSSRGLGRELLVAVGEAVLGQVRDAFVVKSAGGTDESGERWAPLAPATVAYRAARTQTERRRGSRPSQGLTAKQQEQWWEEYRRAMARWPGEKARAARHAWFILKQRGARTLFDKYRGARADILRDTGALLESLTPGAHSGAQVFRVETGSVTIGTSRRGATAQHAGLPGRLPQRRLWPAPANWPPSWWRAVLLAARGKLTDLIVQLLREAT